MYLHLTNNLTNSQTLKFILLTKLLINIFVNLKLCVLAYHKSLVVYYITLYFIYNLVILNIILFLWHIILLNLLNKCWFKLLKI